MFDTQATTIDEASAEAEAASHARQVQVTTRLLKDGAETFRFKLAAAAPLLDVLGEGAARAGAALLPDSDEPLDRLHNFGRHGEVGPAIDGLDQPLGDYIRRPATTRDFGIALVRAFRVNTRWAVASQAALSPRQILELPEIGLNYTEYTLYRPDSVDPLPLDTPVAIERGMAFEAQRDGKYGDAAR